MNMCIFLSEIKFIQITMLKNSPYYILVTLFIFLNISYSFSQGFTVNGKYLYDARGEKFIIRGVNNPHVWLARKSFRSLNTIADLKANSVRVVWMTKGKPGQLERVIEKCIRLKMIPMVELHDVTGKTTRESLMQMTGYFMRDDVKQVLVRYEKYLLINIANEWGDHNMSAEFWRDSYKEAIDSLRKDGYKMTLVIDAPGWGQNLSPILEYGNDLIAHDTLQNLLFSIHMYGSWNEPVKIREKLQLASDKNIPLIVGEFGYNYNQGDNNLKCTVDQQVILETCARLELGYLPWSWSGNNEANAWLDLAESKNWKVLTDWGKSVFEGEYGITTSGKCSSVFEE